MDFVAQLVGDVLGNLVAIQDCTRKDMWGLPIIVVVSENAGVAEMASAK